MLDQENVDDLFDDGDEGDIEKKEWDRMKQSIYKDGYRDGLAVAEDRFLQKGFNEGYKKTVFETFPLAQMRGCISAVIGYNLQHEEQLIPGDISERLKQLHDQIDELGQHTPETVDVFQSHMEQTLKGDICEKPKLCSETGSVSGSNKSESQFDAAVDDAKELESGTETRIVDKNDSVKESESRTSNVSVNVDDKRDHEASDEVQDRGCGKDNCCKARQSNSSADKGKDDQSTSVTADEKQYSHKLTEIKKEVHDILSKLDLKGVQNIFSSDHSELQD